MPTFAEYQAFQVGGFVAPLTSSTTNSLLQDADPALAAILAYYQAVLTYHLGARLDAEYARATVGLGGLVGQSFSQGIPYNPAPFLQESSLTPPLLAVFPARERWSEETRAYVHGEADFTVQWVLPPLTPAQAYALLPAQRAVSKTIVDRTEQGFDPSYLSGARPFKTAGIEQIGVHEVRYGYLAGLAGKDLSSTEIHFPTVEIDLLVAERKMPTPGVTALAGVDSTTQVADDAGAEDVADTSVNFP